MIVPGKIILLVGIFLAFFGIIAGAFGSHLLKSRLSPAMLETYEIAVRYQMYHALALIGVGLVCNVFGGVLVPLSGLILILGVLVFSGSLYAFVFSGCRIFGAITPVGGVVLLLGWLTFALGVARG